MKSTPHKKRRQKKSFLDQARWAGYAAAGVATVLGTHEVADADIHYTAVNKFLDGSIAAGPTLIPRSYVMDVNGDGDDDLYLLHQGYIYNNVKFGGAYVGGINGGQIAGLVAGTLVGGPEYPYAYNLADGTPIPGTPALNFQLNGSMAVFYGYPNSEFKAAGEGLVGFKFDAGAGDQYGWVRVDMVGLTHNAFTVVDYAYADAGETILAGQVPEPGSLGLLATGAIGLLLWRRKRSQKDAA